MEFRKLGNSGTIVTAWCLGTMTFGNEADETGSFAIMDAYAKATKFTPDDPVAWLNLSATAQSAGSLGRAVAAIRQAIKLTPRDADCFSRLGDVLLDVHQLRNDRQSLQDAVDAWQQSLNLNPNQPALVRQVEQYRKLLERTASSTPASMPAN